MTIKHKNKTITTLLATTLGGTGLHRFYLYGKRDFGAWTYLAFFLLYLGLCMPAWVQGSLDTSFLILFPVPVFAALIESLVLGVTPDDQWDAAHNPVSLQQSASGWPLIVILVLTLGGGFVAFIAGMARATDLYLTGGSYG